MQCPKCNSENLYFISDCHLKRKYSVSTDKQVCHGEYQFPIAKNLCKDCGLVFEAMEPEDVKKFKEVESTFVDN